MGMQPNIGESLVINELWQHRTCILDEVKVHSLKQDLQKRHFFFLNQLATEQTLVTPELGKQVI